jgi:hypothetical protein
MMIVRVSPRVVLRGGVLEGTYVTAALVCWREPIQI